MFQHKPLWNENNEGWKRVQELLKDRSCTVFAGHTHNYLSQEDMTLIASRLGISTAKVYSVATFYENFSLEPKGKHIIRVCDGTACHVRKSQPIYDAIHDYMHLTGKRKNDADGLFTLETVACLGACGLSPVLTIDGEVHAKMTPDSALALLESIRKEEELAK